jgi:hypothetical protein
VTAKSLPVHPTSCSELIRDSPFSDGCSGVQRADALYGCGPFSFFFFWRDGEALFAGAVVYSPWNSRCLKCDAGVTSEV